MMFCPPPMVIDGAARRVVGLMLPSDFVDLPPEDVLAHGLYLSGLPTGEEEAHTYLWPSMARVVLERESGEPASRKQWPCDRSFRTHSEHASHIRRHASLSTSLATFQLVQLPSPGIALCIIRALLLLWLCCQARVYRRGTASSAPGRASGRPSREKRDPRSTARPRLVLKEIASALDGVLVVVAGGCRAAALLWPCSAPRRRQAGRSDRYAGHCCGDGGGTLW